MKNFRAVGVGAILALAGFASAGAAPAREYAAVTFREPVKVLDAVLMGDYVIEHDNDRMAAGGPCTHVYKAGDRRTPVLAFHCTHLKRATATKTQVVLRRNQDLGRGFTLTEFQFAGSGDSHGVPAR
jgi:hypothetical protein